MEGKDRYSRKLRTEIAEPKNDLKNFCERNVEFLAKVESVIAKPYCHLDTTSKKSDVGLNGHTKLRNSRS